ILDRTEVDMLRLFSYNVFHGASVDTSVIVLRRVSLPAADHQVEIVRDRAPSGSATGIMQAQRIWQEHPEKFFVLPNPAGLDTLVKKISDASLPLGEFATAYFGIQTFDRGKFVRGIRRTKRFKPVIDGANIGRYSLAASSEFVDFEPEAIKSGGKQDVYERERIGVRQIGESPIPTILPAGMYTLNTIYNIYFTKQVQYDIAFILGIMASKLLKWYWRTTFFDEKRTFPKIKKDALLSIPIPRLDWTDASVRREHDRIAAVVREMLDLRRREAATKNKDEHERLQRLIEATDAQIDGLVYEIYGLTPGEIESLEAAVA
ncbi:MAG: hypothetical protein NTY23_04640, partial [Chloroflexi bacterium]|nr:hypothetical protein [Chloroflexota bacterium]